MEGNNNLLTESDVQSLILAWLLTKRFFVWRNQTSGTYDPRTKRFRAMNQIGVKKGVPDILGVLPDGRLLAIEVKTTKGKVSEKQNDFIRQANSLGALAFVARCLDDVKAHLEDYAHGQTGLAGSVSKG